MNTQKGLLNESLFIYLVGDLTGVAALKWHMTPKKNQAKSTKMQTDADDASKSE